MSNKPLSKEEQQFNECMELAYIKYEVKYALKAMQHIIHFSCMDKQFVELLLKKIQDLLLEIKEGLRKDKKRFRAADNYMCECFDDDFWIR